MSIDWEFLNTKTAEFNNLNLFKDSDNTTIREIIFSGLYVRLSDLNKLFPSLMGSSLAIWADTLIIDDPTFNALGVVIVCRNIDVSMLSNEAMPVRVPEGNDTSVIELVVMESTGGIPFNLTIANESDEKPVFTVPLCKESYQATYFILDSSEKSSTEIKTDPFQFEDLFKRPWALNSFKASFCAASWLIGIDSQINRDAAKSMLTWIISAIKTLEKTNTGIPEAFMELYTQAYSLLLSLNVEYGAHFVPVLSIDIYKQQADKLISALETYENNLNILNERGDIRNAVQEISNTMEALGKDQEIPLNTDLQNVILNAKNLKSDIDKLRQTFDLRYIYAEALRNTMMSEIKDIQTKKFLKNYFGIIVSVTKVGVAAGQMAVGKPDQGGEILSNLAEAAKNAYAAIDTLMTDYPEGSMLERAQALITTQISIIDSFSSSIALWDQLQNNKPLQALSFSPSSITLDPDLAYDNFVIESERVLTNLKTTLGEDSDDAQEAAIDYLASLKVLAQYGKAINRKIIAYTSQLIRAITIRSQMIAVQKSQLHWKELSRTSQSDLEKLDALKGMIKTRIDAIRRSIYLAWINYRNAYLYLYFTEPDVKISLDIDVASLKSSFTEVFNWVARFLGESPNGKKVQVPNDDVKISLSFPIVTHQSILASDIEIPAFLTPATNKEPTVINVNIPKDMSQLREMLPKDGNVAIWIKEVKFFIEGVKPNSKGNVILNISTSGTYENGFAADRVFKFETKGLQSNYGYDINKNVYIPWKINTEVYMTPTLFTQWSIEFDENGGDPVNSTELKMDLILAFSTER